VPSLLYSRNSVVFLFSMSRYIAVASDSAETRANSFGVISRYANGSPSEYDAVMCVPSERVRVISIFA